MQGLDRTDGHAKGAARMSEIIQAANVTGVKAVTFYAFSTEN